MSVASTSPITAIQALGQSVWMDTMSRRFVESGELQARIQEDDLRGCTSNPTIFDKAIRQSADYDQDMQRLVSAGADAEAIYRDLTIRDIQLALDLLRPTFERTNGLDGYVSLEVSPHLARETDTTLAEAVALWELLDRPNAMIKIPGTPEGLPAIEEALYRGLNINITLLFSVQAYEQVANAYIRALQRRAEAGLPIDRIASVASFFVSRIDTEVDNRIEAQLARTSDATERAELESLLGRAAVANAKVAYSAYERIFGSEPFLSLKGQGARVQRLLWASVGTKNPAYKDTVYVDELIGPDTVSTMPPETFDAVKDHGAVQPTLTQNPDEARDVLARLGAIGIDINDVTDLLLTDGIQKFAKSFDDLMSGIQAKRDELLRSA